MTPAERDALEAAIGRIHDLARGFGLDFHPMRFEVVPAEVLYTIGAYGMPTRFGHWTRGKAFWRMKTEYDYNLSRLYELVVNSNPCYAFLLEGNSLVQQKLVAAHVFAHSDFFKHNRRFASAPGDMMEVMASSAERVRLYESRHGRDAVEAFLDAALAIQECVDPFGPDARVRSSGARVRPSGARGPGAVAGAAGPPPPSGPSRERDGYENLWSIGEPPKPPPPPEPRRLPPKPEKDLLRFIIEHARGLEDWQRDLLSVVRDEMLYFWPQLETRIMNEGWATFWHARILRELDLEDAEAVEYAKLHAGILQPSPQRLNPYLIGLRIFEDLERRRGREACFEVRELDTDVSFLRNYLTEELVEELDLYLFRKVGEQWQVVEKDWERVRDGLAAGLTNGGLPVIVVLDGDHNGAGELFLLHRHDGQELDLEHAEKTLAHVHRLWGRPVSLETIVDSKPLVLSYDGERVIRRVASPRARRADG